MRRKDIVVLMARGLFALQGCIPQRKNVNTLNSTRWSLFLRKELKKQGDFGISAFDKLDGEMIVFSGNFYQITTPL